MLPECVELPLDITSLFSDVIVLFAQLDVFEAAMRYKQEGTPVIVLAGKEYGSGSSRDWAAKGPWILVSVPARVLCVCISRISFESSAFRLMQQVFNMLIADL